MFENLLTHHGITTSIVLGFVSLLIALWLIRSVLAASAGNDRMKEIAAAIQAGAAAYLHRQVMAISAIALVMVVAVGFLRNWTTASGFVVGAVCSLIAGYIGMNIAVRANVRTAQAASVGPRPALRVAFNGGAVTGLLVVGLGLVSVGAFYLIVKYFTHV